MELKPLFALIISFLGITVTLAYGFFREEQFPLVIGVLNLMLWSVKLRYLFNCGEESKDAKNELLSIGLFSVFSISSSVVGRVIALGGSLTLAFITLVALVKYKEFVGGRQR